MSVFDTEDAPLSGDAAVAILAWAVVFLAAAEVLWAFVELLGRL